MISYKESPKRLNRFSTQFDVNTALEILSTKYITNLNRPETNKFTMHMTSNT